MSRVTVRQAREADVGAVVSFTGDTWGDRHDDYISGVFADWVASDDETQRTLVATVSRDAVDDAAAGDDSSAADSLRGDDAAAADSEVVVGCVQGVLLSEWEAWAQGIRVDPAARGLGVGSHLSAAVLEWARAAGATVCRNMVFSWNVAGLGQSRAAGFGPATEFRFARPDPDPNADPPAAVTDSLGPVTDPDPNAAWAFWADSDARDHLRRLALDPVEPWACSALTRERLAAAADDGRLLAVADGGLSGIAVHTRVVERDAPDDGGVERTATYGVAAWRDTDAAGALYASIARDAADRGADSARVFIPETAAAVSDTAANRVAVAGEPDFVMAADLTE